MLSGRSAVGAWPWVLAAVCSVACAAGDAAAPQVAKVSGAISLDNGRQINGRQINGRQINGTVAVGYVTSVSLVGVTLDGQPLEAVTLEDGVFSGAGRARRDLVGAVFKASISDGGEVPVRIDATRVGALAVTGYDVSYMGVDGWTPLCGVDGETPVEAYAIDAVWSLAEGVPGGGARSVVPGRFTFACANAALGKCVALGYVPWRVAHGTSLVAAHQSCARALRADYCGDGRSGTIDGWTLNLYDSLGVQRDTENDYEWMFEAVWSPEGALCVDEYRAFELVVTEEVPTCVLDRVRQPCPATGLRLTSEFSSRGLIDVVDEIVALNEGAPLSDKLEDALAKLEEGFAIMGDHQASLGDAVSSFSIANGDLEAAVDDQLLATSYGLGLMNRITGVARHLAVRTMSDHACDADSVKLAEAQTELARGDSERAAARHRDACAAYKDAIDLAGDAGGRPCPPAPPR
jgi:hypothetical protein